jgi:phosphatidylglycerol:prolipoprotein diacylglycerol transferase
MYAVAFLVAFQFGAWPHIRDRGISRQQAEGMLGWTVIAGLVGARLYYDVQNNPVHYLTHPQDIFAFWQGGMAFSGAMGAGLLTLGLLARRYHLSFWLLGDAAALFACIGQPIGRIGNVINGDILGQRSPLPWATAYTYPTGMGHCAVLQSGFVCGVGYQPAAASEALGTLVLLAVLIMLRRRFPTMGGLLTIVYVTGYALSQLLIFFLRASEPVVLFGLKQAQVTGLVVLLVIVPCLIVAWKRSPLSSKVLAPSQVEALTS